MLLVQLLGTWLLNRKILLADMLQHGAFVSNGGVYVLFHDRPVNTASGTRTHFDKALLNFAVSYVTQSVHAVFCSVYRYVFGPFVDMN